MNIYLNVILGNLTTALIILVLYKIYKNIKECIVKKDFNNKYVKIKISKTKKAKLIELIIFALALIANSYLIGKLETKLYGG